MAAALAAAKLAVDPTAGAAQIDYRNLDDDRPTRVEDAYPVERHAFEWILPWHFEAQAGAGRTHAIIPELSYGIFSNAQLGVKLAAAWLDENGRSNFGLSGVRVFGLYNFNTESPSLPAFSLRLDATLPVGELAASKAQVAVKALATRSWGRNRFHLNAAYTLNRVQRAAAVEGLPRWWAGAAVDRTLFRQSLLLVAETFVNKPETGGKAEVVGSLGVRYQLTTTSVLDFGVAQGFQSNRGPNPSLTVGISKAFALPGLMGGNRR
ncbi:MAG: hypothetical protein ABI647_17590 [Gemmatimonadota bacterium]